MSIESVMSSSHLILCRPLLLLPPVSPSIRVFSSESTLRMRWPEYWSFRFSIRPSNEHSGLISFRMTNSINFCLRKSLFQLHFWRILLLDTEFKLFFFFFKHFKYFTALSCFNNFWREANVIFFYPSAFFTNCLFFFYFLQFKYDMPSGQHFGICPAWYSLSFLDLRFGICHYL